MKKTHIAVAVMALALAGCDEYANNGTGTTKINEITVYHAVRCVLVTQSSSNTIACDWDHPGERSPS